MNCIRFTEKKLINYMKIEFEFQYRECFNSLVNKEFNILRINKKDKKEFLEKYQKIFISKQYKNLYLKYFIEKNESYYKKKVKNKNLTKNELNSVSIVFLYLIQKNLLYKK